MEGAGVAVVVFDVGVDALDELLDAAKGAAADGALGDETEPEFDLIEPRRVGRGVVDVVTRPGGEPGANLGVLVGGVVVDDQVQVERGWNALIEVPEEGEELLMAVPSLAWGDDLAAFARRGAANSVVVPWRR